MNLFPFLTLFGAWLQRLACEWRDARRVRREIAELARMSAHELSDLGISHASIAASALREPCCH